MRSSAVTVIFRPAGSIVLLERNRVPKIDLRPIFDRRYKASELVSVPPDSEVSAQCAHRPLSRSTFGQQLDRRFKAKIIARKNILKRRCNASEMTLPMLDRINTNSQEARFRRKSGSH